MKTRKLLLGIVAIAAMLLTACGKDDNGGNGGGSVSKPLANTTWQLNSPNDEAYYGADVVYTVSFGSKDEITFTRKITTGEIVTNAVMVGTYTYSNGSGEAMIHNEGEDTDFRATFTVSDKTLVWKFNLREITLTKI